MSDLKAVVAATRELQSILQTQFGGQGRGLRDTLGKVTRPVPNALGRRIREVAALRAKAVAGDETAISDVAEFVARCRTLGEELVALRGTAANSVATPDALEPAADAVVAPRRRAALWGVLGIAAVAVGAAYATVGREGHPGGEGTLEPANVSVARPVTAPSPSRLAFKEVEVSYHHDMSYHRYDVTIHLTVTNTGAIPLSNASFAARLYLDNAPTPLFTTSLEGAASGPSHIYAIFGDGGLQPGETRRVEILVNTLSDSQWVTPNAVAARNRRVELALMELTDNRERLTVAAESLKSASWH